MSLLFKESNLKEQWDNPNLRQDLRFIVLAACGYTEMLFGRPLTVSCIYRTLEENKVLQSKSLTHVEWRAVDCSGIGWEQKDLEKIASFVNGIVDTGFGDIMPVCYSAEHGTGKHSHFQVPSGKSIIFKIKPFP